MGAAAVVIADVALLASGRRVLVHERLVPAGESVTVPGYGATGVTGQSFLVCRYFTGRSVLHTVLWYSPNNVLGRDSCPAVTSAGP